MSDATELTDLTQLLLELCSMPCVTGEEGPIADWLAARYAARGDVVMRLGNSVVAAPPERPDDERPTVLLVSHIDVVPPTDADIEPRVEDRLLIGRGASDMKSGMAVSMDVFEDSGLRDGRYRMVLVGYAGEEGPAEGNELRQVLAAVPGLTDAALAIVLEPTDLRVQLGCMGGLHAEVVIEGRAAHSARPWHGDNALTRAGAWLSSWHDVDPVDVQVDGLTFREVISPTQGNTRNARNVIPDSFAVNVNYRFAPDKTSEQAEQLLRARLGDVGPVSIIDRAPPCPPGRGEGLVDAFVEAAQAEVAPQQSWTDVARFAEVGVPALNYGPGDTTQSHQRGESVPLANLQPARDALARFLR